MAIENEFLPFLNNWTLLFVVMAFGYNWVKIDCINPALNALKVPVAPPEESESSTPTEDKTTVERPSTGIELVKKLTRPQATAKRRGQHSVPASVERPPKLSKVKPTHS